MGSEDDSGDKDDASILKKLHSFIDGNYRLIKYSSYGIGVVGILLIGRSIRVAQVFRRVEEIPDHFVQQHVQLLGRVERVGDLGLLHVRHIPILKLQLLQQGQGSQLPVSLACVNVTPAGKKWLCDNLLHHTVWFKLLHRDHTPPTLQTIVHVRLPKNLRKSNINEELVRLGLCTVKSYGADTVPLPTEPEMLVLLDRLVQLESVAAKKGTGLWKETQSKSSGKRLKTSLSAIKTVLLSPFTFISWVAKKLRR